MHVSSSGRPSRPEKRQERRQLIQEKWAERYPDVLNGNVTLAEILNYDDQRLLKLAEKGLSFLRVGKLDKALSIFRGLVILDPWLSYSHYLLAGAWEKLGDYSRALNEYQSALDLLEDVQPPPDITAFAALGRGRVLARANRFDEAIAVLQQVRDGAFPVREPSVPQTAQLILKFIQEDQGV